jgi:hypothetical protein
MTTRSSLGLVLAASLLVATPVLSGCSLIDNFLPNGVSGGIPAGVVPTQTIPDDFPSDVPLVDGDVVLGVTLPGENGDTAWNVTMKVADAEAFDEITTQLTDAGFDYQQLGSNDDGSSGAFTKDPYTVLVVVASAKGEWTANYTVTDAETGQ